MIVSKKGFQKFVQDHAERWPWSEIRLTRTSYSPEWTMMLSFKGNDVLPQIVRAACFYKDTLQHLVVTLQALPVPPKASEVLSYMEHKGKKVSVDWCNEVVMFVFRQMNNGHPVANCALVLHCLKCRVKEMLSDALAATPDAQVALLNHWVENAVHQHIFRGNRNIDSLGACSFHFIEQAIRDCNVPVTNVPVTSVPSTVNVVSPTSSQSQW